MPHWKVVAADCTAAAATGSRRATHVPQDVRVVANGSSRATVVTDLGAVLLASGRRAQSR